MSNNLKDDLTFLQKEPALVRGLILAIVGVLGSVGLAVSDSTTAAIVTLVMAVLGFLVALWTRNKVTPVDKAKAQEKQAVDTAVADANAESAKAIEAAQVIDAPAPVVPAEDTLSYDSSATVDSTNTVSDVVESSVEDADSGDPLGNALKTLANASAAKDEAVSAASKALEAVQDEAVTSAASYASTIADAQSKLAAAKAK